MTILVDIGFDSHSSNVSKQFAGHSIAFIMIPVEDRHLVRKGGVGLQDYWLDCWQADPYGSRYVLMADADLKSTTQAKYRKELEALGLFMFEIRKQGGDRKLWVLNRHGSRVKNFWKTSVKNRDAIEQPIDETEETLAPIEKKLDGIEQINPGTQSRQGFQNASTSFQHLNSTSSSISAELEFREEGFELEEKEEKVEASDGGELLEWVVELKIPALNLKDPPRNPEAYARAMIVRDGDALRKEFAEVVAEKDFYARADELTQKVEARAIEWEQAGIKVNVFHDLSRMPVVMLDGDTLSAVDFLTKPIEQRSELLAALSNLDNIQNRSYRLSRLRSADMVGECPGVEFLAECWGDILLRSQVKSLISRYSQWEISLELLESRTTPSTRIF